MGLIFDPKSNSQSLNRSIFSSLVSGKSERDVTEFVKYLLEGSGAEANVDFAALRRDLEGATMNTSAILNNEAGNQNNNILDAMSFATSPASKKFYKEMSPLTQSQQEVLLFGRGEGVRREARSIKRIYLISHLSLKTIPFFFIAIFRFFW